MLKGQWALILGGSSGLGLATVKKLASAGMNIVVVHRDRSQALAEVEQTFNTIRDSGVQLIGFNENALDESVRKKIIEHLSSAQIKIRCLVHSIAKGNLKKLLPEHGPALEKADLDITIHAMATSWWEWTHDLLKHDLWDKDARNLAFTSEGNEKYIPYYAAVSAAKATLEVLCRYMAVELAPKGIRTNLLQSGVVATPSMRMIPDSEKILQLTLKRNPAGRLTRPEDIANAVYLLCQPEAGWVNGTTIKVDGGESLF